MSNWKYKKSTDIPQGKDYLVRKKDSLVEDWNSQRKTWKRNNDAIGAFIGFDDHFDPISEEEAQSIISSYY